MTKVKIYLFYTILFEFPSSFLFFALIRDTKI